MGWWIALTLLVLLALLAILPLGVRVRYDAGGFYLGVLAGPVSVQLYPERKKSKKSTRKQKDKPKKQSGKPKKTVPQKDPQPPQPVASDVPEVPQESPKEKGGDWKQFLPYLPLVWDLLGNLRRKIRVNRLEFRLILAGADPCDLAVNYGKTWAAVGNILPWLDRVCIIKKRDVEVECDFTASKTIVTARMDLTITVGRILAMAVRLAILWLKEYSNLRPKRKGGAVT